MDILNNDVESLYCTVLEPFVWSGPADTQPG